MDYEDAASPFGPSRSFSPELPQLYLSQLLSVLDAFRRGDFTVRMPKGLSGIAGEVAATLNEAIGHGQRLSTEIARLNQEVGKAGRVIERGTIGDVGGSWQTCITELNGLLDDLVWPTAEVGRVIGAVASGDLAQTMSLDIDGRPLRGEFLRSAKVVNGMVEQLSSFASEVTRVVREVGSDGKLGGQAQVSGVAGTWKDLTDNVNSMASNLTAQVRNIAEVTTAVARGDLGRKITVDVRGEILELKITINTMVDQLNAFASEVTRVAREVGTEGKLGGQAQVKGVAGTWKDLTDNVNSMASNLTAQVRNIAEVTTAVARGDLGRKITVDVAGEILELKDTINTMVDQLRAFAAEVTRVAREVGTEGKLGGQAQVDGVAGVWKDLTDNVNSMASNLTAQVRNIAEVTTAVARGDLGRKITVDVAGEILELKNTINTMVDQLNGFASEVTRVAREVGTEGKLGGQAQVKGVAGTWKDLTDNVNSMASNLTAQVRNIAEVTTAVARGDLGRKITVDVAGEILELKNTINTMVDQLNGFASEVTRVAREVGTEGKLGGQAQVKGVAGTWKDLTDNVNYMASNLTDQVRGIAKVVTAVARGDLTRKLALEARGEIAELAETINGMTRTLATFAEQVTTVAREVGVEGKLGGQAHVPGTAGTWRDLVDNVNQLAGNLTTQVRAIGDVARSVTKGDLTRSIDVEALGEVAALKDNINEMIRALRETTKKTTEQDWLKTNLARFTRMLQGQRDLVTVARQVLSELIPLVSAQFGVLYIADHDRPGETVLKLLASYAGDSAPPRFRLGEGLVGQCAFEKRKIVIENMPASYIEIRSGLGAAAPQTLIVLPVLFEGQVNAVIELASFGRFSEIHMTFLDQLMESIGIVVNTISASMRTEALLQQSQSLTTELRKTNEQLEEKATLLELKNNEVELAKREVEDKAEQLTLTSKYKSQFLANMSHELRTPLNSLLILSRMLTDNVEGNLTQKQVEFSRAIHSAGTDLLALITDILDLSKIESGTISVEVEEVQFVDLRDYVEQSFRHVALQKSLGFAIELAPNLPRSMSTDAKRLQQVLKNLLSNAFKFTERGQVTLRIELVNSGWSRGIPTLDRPERAIAFTVEDTGIGIAENKQQIIFDAFQQADGTTSRKYGGTGLGLSISRELTRLLGGDIQVHSQLGQGATFTLYVPLTPTDVIPAVRRPDTNPPAMALALERAKTHEVIEVPNEVHVLVVGDAADLRAMIEAGRRRGFRAITSGPAQAVAMCQVTNPTSVYVDLDLPNGEGWLVIDELCNDSATRHLPIFVRCDASNASHARGLGAVEVVNGLDSVLDSLQQGRRLIPSYVGLVAHDDVLNVVAADLPTVVELRRLDTIDDVHAASSDPACGCIVVDLANAGAIAAMSPRVPVVAWADPARPTSQREIVRMFSDPALVHPVYSRGGLLAATTRYMHVRGTSMAFTLRGELERFLSTASLTGTRVAVVDDDVRNIFAITCALESHGATVLHADGGHDAIALVEREPDIDLVLMDVMMPELDGYEVMRRIRAQERFHSLPIVALTARAMKADRDKCLTAGATDYVAKPVNTQRLVSAIRVWRRP